MSKFFGWFNKDSQNNTDANAQNDTPPEEKAQSLEAEQTAQETDIKDPQDIDATPEAQAVLVEQTPNNEKSIAGDNNETNEDSFFSRLKSGLSRTSTNIGDGIANLFLGKKIDEDLFEELETQLLMADVGMETTLRVIEDLTEVADRKQLKSADDLYPLLKERLATLLEPVSKPLSIPESTSPFVILMVGVNGVGKTTTIGKMAKQLQAQGKQVMLAAGDTFRAAAVEQLQVWGERNEIPVVAQHTGADSASVLFDALQSAKAKNVDVLIADTAGRLQNKDHLMEELKKVVRVMKKLDPEAPHEIMLTLDAGTGQNALSQMQLFNEAVGVTGVTLSKLDGTAKGGVIFPLADKFNTPIRFIGVGEAIDDLQAFSSKDFVEALFTEQ